jgi:hypothetical protein
LTALLRELLTGDTREANNYTEHIQEYNSAMAFSSLGAEIKSPPINNPYYFRIHGQNYHLDSQPYPNEANKPRYVEFYILDSAEATKRKA